MSVVITFDRFGLEEFGIHYGDRLIVDTARSPLHGDHVLFEQRENYLVLICHAPSSSSTTRFNTIEGKSLPFGKIGNVVGVITHVLREVDYSRPARKEYYRRLR